MATLRAPSHPGGREDHRRLLRHDAGAHPGDGRRHPAARAAQPARASVRYSCRIRWTRIDAARRTSRAALGVDGDAVRRAVALGGARSRAASSSRRSRSCRRAAWMRRGCSRDVAALKEAGVDAVNVPDGPRAQSRMGALHDEPPHRAAGRHRDGHALLLPRPQSARHAERPARRGGDGAAQPAHHHRRSAEDGPVSGRDRGLRHRLDRAHESREPAEPRARSGRQRDRRSRRGSRSASA